MRSDYSKIEAGTVFFALWHEQWDANIDHHADQGIIIQLCCMINGAEQCLLQFNCFHVERSYIYDPDGVSGDNARNKSGNNARNKSGDKSGNKSGDKSGCSGKICQIDPVTDGNPIGWSVRQIKTRLPEMLRAAGFAAIADGLDMAAVRRAADQLEDEARATFRTAIQLVKHPRGDFIFEAGNIRFGLELRRLNDDSGLAIHVMSDLCGGPGHDYAEETEIIAFDCFRLEPHYHYGPRNKNLRYYWDKAVVPDTLEWTLDVLKAGKLARMIEAAGYPDVARDLDPDLVQARLPEIEAKARELQPRTEPAPIK